MPEARRIRASSARPSSHTIGRCQPEAQRVLVVLHRVHSASAWGAAPRKGFCSELTGRTDRAILLANRRTCRAGPRRRGRRTAPAADDPFYIARRVCVRPLIAAPAGLAIESPPVRPPHRGLAQARSDWPTGEARRPAVTRRGVCHFDSASRANDSPGDTGGGLKLLRGVYRESTNTAGCVAWFLVIASVGCDCQRRRSREWRV